VNAHKELQTGGILSVFDQKLMVFLKKNSFRSHIMKEKHQANFELLIEFRKVNKLFNSEKHQA